MSLPIVSSQYSSPPLPPSTSSVSSSLPSPSSLSFSSRSDYYSNSNSTSLSSKVESLFDSNPTLSNDFPPSHSNSLPINRNSSEVSGSLFAPSATSSSNSSSSPSFDDSSDSDENDSLGSVPRIRPAELHGKYELIREIGSGSYGQVHLCRDRSTGQQVAIKKVPLTFDNLTNAKRLLREIKILRMFDHPNIIQFLGLIAPVDPSQVHDLLIVFEFVETDLQKLIHSDQPFTNDHVQYFIYQLLAGVNYIHSANIIHRDLKPANILVSSSCKISIIDFGLARATPNEEANNKAKSNQTNNSIQNNNQSQSQSFSQNPTQNLSQSQSQTQTQSQTSSLTYPKPLTKRQTSVVNVSGSVDIGLKPPSRLTRELTKHVVTRWYRAPELILLNEKYTTAIDLWSVGCVLAELLSMQTQSYKYRMPLFPGKTCFPFSADNPLAYTDQLDQLNVIFDVLGTPTPEEIEKIENDKARSYLRGLNPKKRINFAHRYPGADPRAIDLLSKLLNFDSETRLTASQALNHPYLADIRNEADEAIYSNSAQVDWSFESEELTAQHVRELIVKEILIDNPELKEVDFDEKNRKEMKKGKTNPMKNHREENHNEIEEEIEKNNQMKKKRKLNEETNVQ